MAEVFNRVRGMKLERAMALTREAQGAITEQAHFRAMKAEGLLNHTPKHRTGDSKITMEHGDVDWHVVLDDELGLQHALTIEYGRKAYEDPETGEEKGAMEGLFILHKSFPEIGRTRRPKKGGDDLD